MSLLIGKDLVVSIHYTLTNNDGEVLDSSEGQAPLNFLHGAGNIIPGLENALIGKVKGDSLKVTIQPEDAYGMAHPEMIQELPRDLFQGVDELTVGMAFQAQGPDGQTQMVTITGVNGDKVTVDANHPLAGVVLNFDVSIEEVREATREEMDHGHVH